MPGRTSPRRLQLLHVGPRGAAVDGLGEGAGIHAVTLAAPPRWFAMPAGNYDRRRGSEPDETGDEKLYAAERPQAFFDAVVAIAMTLLILPLMESVGDVGGCLRRRGRRIR